MSRYAEDTQVSSERSKAEIERTLRRYGATGFMYATRGSQAVVGFEAANRHVRFVIELPAPEELERTPTGRARAPAAAERAYEQAVRQRWRALGLVIKAKLEAVETGISVFEEEFLAHIVLPGNKTVYQEVAPKIARAYDNGRAPALLEDMS